jgi:uncharacterized protein YebE (UPF0316 family)
MDLFSDFDVYGNVILPLIIFFSRLFDVTLGTIRHVFIARGFRKLVPFLGFFEVLIWIVVVRQVMSGVSGWPSYIAWAGGFAAGSYVGLFIEEKLALGMQILRIVTHQDTTALEVALRNANHGVTVINGSGSQGPVRIIFMVLNRDDIREVEKLIFLHNPSAFYSLEDVKDASRGVFRSREERKLAIRRLFPIRKGK